MFPGACEVEPKPLVAQTDFPVYGHKGASFLQLCRPAFRFSALNADWSTFGVPVFACTTKTMPIEGIVKDAEAYMGIATLIHLRVIPAICRPKRSLDAPLYAFGHLGSFLAAVLKALVM